MDDHDQYRKIDGIVEDALECVVHSITSEVRRAEENSSDSGEVFVCEESEREVYELDVVTTNRILVQVQLEDNCMPLI